MQPDLIQCLYIVTESVDNRSLTWQQQAVEPMHTHGNVNPACIHHNAVHCALNPMHTTEVLMHAYCMKSTPIVMLQRTQTNGDVIQAHNTYTQN